MFAGCRDMKPMREERGSTSLKSKYVLVGRYVYEFRATSPYDSLFDFKIISIGSEVFLAVEVGNEEEIRLPTKVSVVEGTVT
jgi:Tfp pilus assembly protein PilZ